MSTLDRKSSVPYISCRRGIMTDRLSPTCRYGRNFTSSRERRAAVLKALGEASRPPCRT